MRIIAIVGLAFALLVAVFAIQNSTPVTVTFLKWRLVDLSLAIVILGSAAAGALVIGLVGAVREIGLGFGVRSWRAKAERLASELDATRGKAVSLEQDVATLQRELRDRSQELDLARQRVAELEAELEATRCMELLPKPQEGADGARNV